VQKLSSEGMNHVLEKKRKKQTKTKQTNKQKQGFEIAEDSE